MILILQMVAQIKMYTCGVSELKNVEDICSHIDSSDKFDNKICKNKGQSPRRKEQNLGWWGKGID